MCLKRISNLLKYLGLALFFNVSISFAFPPSFCAAVENNANMAFFANYAINALFTFSFVNYRTLSNYSNLLTPSAWAEYNNYLNKSTILVNLKQQKLIAGSFFKESAHVISKQNNSWQVSVPFILNLKSASNGVDIPINAMMTIALDKRQKDNCGLKITAIQFNKIGKASDVDRFKEILGIGAEELPYKENVDSKVAGQQPYWDDIAVLTTANVWLLSNKDIDPSLIGPLLILQKGLLQETFMWRLQLTMGITLLVTQEMTSPFGLKVDKNGL
jgi:hypothetical protein